MEKSFSSFCSHLIQCTRCPRLVSHREKVKSLKAYEDLPHWRKPVPGFGDEKAWLLILGLAPSAQGGNRTGRIFTGDESARFLFKALYKCGLSNQSDSLSQEDGLKLYGCYLTAMVKCVPPDNKPKANETVNCSPYFANELLLLRHVKVILALGHFAFDSYIKFMKTLGQIIPKSQFHHGARVIFPNEIMLYGSYHPSPQNTYTKKLTFPMFVDLLERIKTEVSPK